jgi:hypothetical protein
MQEAKLMYRRILPSAIFLFGLSSVAQAVPTVNVGLHPLQDSSPNQLDSIDVLVSGGDLIRGETLVISVGDEGNGRADPADVGEPKIVSVDIVNGTIFAGNNTGQQDLFDTDQVFQRSTTTSSGDVAASGTLFTIVIDRNGAPASLLWDLRAIFVMVPELGGPFFSAYDTATSVGDPFVGTNGMFSYGPLMGSRSLSNLPEPSSLVLGLLAAAGLAAVAIRRRRAEV